MIPIQPGTYIVTDDQSATWNLSGYLDSGNWQVTGYNTGLYDHTVYLTFLLNLPGVTEAAPPPPSDSGAGIVGTGGTVVTPPPGGTGGVTAPPAVDDSAAVISVVLAAFAAQLAAAPAG